MLKENVQVIAKVTCVLIPAVSDKILYDQDPCWLPTPADPADDLPDEMLDGNFSTHKNFSLVTHNNVTVILYNAPANSKYIHILGPDLECSPAKGFLVSYYRLGMTKPAVCLTYGGSSAVNYPLNICVFKCNEEIIDFHMVSFRITQYSPIMWTISEIQFG